jgi:hypothetical protein
MKFNPGRIVAMPGALKVLRNNGVSPRRFVRHYISGDCGVSAKRIRPRTSSRSADR